MSTVKEGISNDFPPYSRLFVICGKDIRSINLKELFSQFGDVEDVFIPRDYQTNALKGIAYVKFAKTSHAAIAQDKLNNSLVKGSSQPLKVIVACNRSDVQDDQLENSCKRLFITCSKSDNENTLYDYFKKFGHVVSVIIQRERTTGASKGFAYISYEHFSESAKAYEEADKIYNVVFAKPKGRTNGSLLEDNMSALANLNLDSGNNFNKLYEAATLTQAMNVKSEGYTRVLATCNNYLLPKQIENIFNLVPGMLHFQYTRDLKRNRPKILVTYSNPVSAKYAVQRLNYFEYPQGDLIRVKPEFSNKYRPKAKPEICSAVNNVIMAMSGASNTTHPDLKKIVDTVAKVSNVVKSVVSGDRNAVIDDFNYCSVSLPSPKPLVGIDSPIAKRCFLVLYPNPPPQTVLLDVFCRFGNLITVYCLPGKFVGYANYASVESADMAIKTLHGATLCKVRIKVLEAEEKEPCKN